MNAEPISVGAALDRVARRLTAAHVDRPRPDARLLVAEVLGAGIEKVMGYPETILDPAQVLRLETMVARRETREPMAHILGRREFWSLNFSVTADTLTPRPDTETVVEAALANRPKHPDDFRILDLGTGTGCLLLAVLHELPGARGVGVDISNLALDIARRNAEDLGLADRVEFVQSDWGEGVTGKFHMVLSNPPYIPDGEIDDLELEVANFDPRGALAGGPDGLECYRTILWQLPKLLEPNGVALFEVGHGQSEAVCEMAVQRGLVRIEVCNDLSGIARCVVVGATNEPDIIPNEPNDQKKQPE